MSDMQSNHNGPHHVPEGFHGMGSRAANGSVVDGIILGATMGGIVATTVVTGGLAAPLIGMTLGGTLGGVVSTNQFNKKKK